MVSQWILEGWSRGGSRKHLELHPEVHRAGPQEEEGNELDEFWAHKFLESFGETLTILELREKLKKIDLDVNGKMGLLEYLCFKYNKTVKQCVEAPQGGNEELLAAAQAKLNDVQTALIAQQAALEEQRVQEEKVKKAEAELRDAVAELKAQEDAYHAKIQALEQKANDASGTVVSRNKAANELAQVKGEDPLPLRKAKITQEASLRKVEKERKAAEVATLNLEAKVRELEKLFQEAEAQLKKLREMGGSSQGAIWWMTRELKEAQKYLPKKKQTMV